MKATRMLAAAIVLFSVPALGFTDDIVEALKDVHPGIMLCFVWPKPGEEQKTGNDIAAAIRNDAAAWPEKAMNSDFVDRGMSKSFVFVSRKKPDPRIQGPDYNLVFARYSKNGIRIQVSQTPIEFAVLLEPEDKALNPPNGLNAADSYVSELFAKVFKKPEADGIRSIYKQVAEKKMADGRTVYYGQFGWVRHDQCETPFGGGPPAMGKKYWYNQVIFFIDGRTVGFGTGRLDGDEYVPGQKLKW